MAPESNADKARWLQEAEEAFEQVFGKDFKWQDKTFDQLEAEVVEMGDRLTAWMLERRVNAQTTSQVDSRCPDCGAAGQPKKEEQEVRPVETTRGVVAFARQGFYCQHCRRVFFSGGPETGPQS